MAVSGEIDRAPVTLADRFDAYRIDIEGIVTRGIEHANYELKRSATISKDNLADRLDFVKLDPGPAQMPVERKRNSSLSVPIRRSENSTRFQTLRNSILPNLHPYWPNTLILSRKSRFSTIFDLRAAKVTY